ncbi:PAS domain-containing protein [Pontibacter sp. HSC-36F09]|uniref:PAS domain-containing protein n=1 Tax=Pontibacter sp. HSC-36F09 TaxID=2910966 RepID=UPI00209E9DA9|nr:PAS domain-containing protein [Pontibacter sp. HSC-36F09]MCP2042667.1 PAS domain S-box-containing protein [Pontibacter sp. HSC-36F09]
MLEPIFRALPRLYAVLNPDLVIVEATDALLKLFQMTREQIIGHPLFELFPNNPKYPEFKESVLQCLQHALTHKESFHNAMLRYDIQSASGYEERYWSATSVPVLNDVGEVQYLIHEVSDVTDKVLFERLHQQSQEQLNLISNATKAIAWEYDIVNDCMHWGEGLQEILGYTPEEMGPGGKSWDSRVHPDDFDEVQRSIKEALDNKQSAWKGEYRFQKADGSYAYILDQGYTTYDSEGEPIRTIGSIINITQNRDTQQALRESDARFHHLLEALPHMAWTASPKGKVLFFNENWYSYTGMRRGHTHGWISVVHPEDSAMVLTSWHNAVASDTSFEIEYRIRHHLDGSYRWFLERGLPMRDANGNITLWIGTYTDIDDQKNQVEEHKDDHLENLLRLSPVHLCLLHGPNHVCQYVTPGVYKLYGNRSYVGHTAREIWPELEPIGFFDLLHEVYTKGRTVYINEFRTQIDDDFNGNPRDAFFNFKYQPLFDSTSTVEGIMISAIEVTNLVIARQRAEALARGESGS